MLKFLNDFFKIKDRVEVVKPKEAQIDIRVIAPRSKIDSTWSILIQAMRVAQGEHKALFTNVGGDRFLIEVMPGEAYCEFLTEDTYKNMCKLWGHEDKDV